MEQHRGGPVSPTNPYDCEGSGSQNMLEEREVAQVALSAGMHAAMVSVARAWRALQKQEGTASRAWGKVEAAIDELMEARAREEACMVAAASARERVLQVRGEADEMVEDARARGSAAQESAMEDASAQLRAAVHRVHRADDDYAIAGAATDDAEDSVDALDSAAVAANARVEQAQAKLRAAEQGAEWLRAVAFVARWQKLVATEAAVVAAAQVAVRAQVAREAAAVGAARMEAKWTALARETWQAALARDEQAAAADEREAAAAVEREVREAAVAWAAARKVVLNGAAGLTAETANGRHEVAVECELCGPGRWRWSWRGRGARGGARGAEMRRRREPCRRRERRRPWESRIARGDDGGSWRQFDPGG
jgi:colicin import membrane protein